MSTNTLWSCDRLTRLHDIEDIVKRDLRETTGATNSLIGRLDDTNDTTKSYISRVDDMYPVATPVTQEQTMHFDDGDQTKTYTNLKCLRCPGSSFDGASNTLKTHDIDWNNNTLGTQPCTFNSIRSEMGSVYSTDLYSNLKETIVQQECDTVMNDAASNMSSTFSCTSPSVSEDSNSTDRTPGSPSSSYSSSSQCISNVPAYNISHSIYMCTAFQSNIKSIKTERCVHIPDNNLEMISTPFKIISHRLHSGGEVSSYVISNPKGDNSLIKNAVDTSSPMFKELLHSLSIAPGYDPRMTQSIWMSQVTLPEQEMTSPIAEVTSQQEASIMTSQTPATDNEEDDKAYQELRKSKTRKQKRSCLLWEYIRNLLLDTKTNPDLICWVNRTEGSFKLVDSKKISHMWGMKKGNENMNYEKLSRAMRYYYKSEVFLPVLGKRLVYKFGPKAMGWKE